METTAERERLRTVTAAGALVSASIYAISSGAALQVGLVIVALCGLALLLRSELLTCGLTGAAHLRIVMAGIPPRFIADRLSPEDVVSAVALVSCLLFTLRHIERYGPRRKVAPATPTDQGTRTEHRPQSARRDLSGVIVRVAVASAVAVAVLWLLPVGSMRYNIAGLVPSAFRALVILVVLAAAGLAVGAAFGYATWRRLLPGQARLYARTALAAELRREQPLVERARVRRRRARRLGWR